MFGVVRSKTLSVRFAAFKNRKRTASKSTTTTTTTTTMWHLVFFLVIAAPTADAQRYGGTFDDAFGQAHRDLGAGQTFEWGGRSFSTDRADGRDLRQESMGNLGNFPAPSPIMGSPSLTSYQPPTGRSCLDPGSVFIAPDPFPTPRPVPHPAPTPRPVPQPVPAPTPQSPPTEPLGIRHNNPGNLVKTDVPWEGKVSNPTGRFEKFDTPHNGIRALARNLAYYSVETQAAM